MTPADVDAAAAMIRGANWGDPHAFFTFAADHSGCLPFVAEAGGEVVGTGIATVNGPAGWVGRIFVSPQHRGRGLGRALTETVTEALEAAGCRTLVLVATAAGRPIYEKLGFRLDPAYRVIEAPGTAGRQDPAVRAFDPVHLDAILALDRAATGEDRAHLLRRLATPATARVLCGTDGSVRGFIVDAIDKGRAATVAPDLDDGLRLLAARRAAAAVDERVRAGVVETNTDALARLADLGWTDAWTATRMIRGEPLAWNPNALWGQLNFALG